MNRAPIPGAIDRGDTQRNNATADSVASIEPANSVPSTMPTSCAGNPSCLFNCDAMTGSTPKLRIAAALKATMPATSSPHSRCRPALLEATAATSGSALVRGRRSTSRGRKQMHDCPACGLSHALEKLARAATGAKQDRRSLRQYEYEVDDGFKIRDATAR